MGGFCATSKENNNTSDELTGENAEKLCDKTKSKINMTKLKMIKVIGKGSFGKVILVQDKLSSNFYALKILKKDSVIKRKQIEHTKTERNTLAEVSSPFIVGLHFAFQTHDRLFLGLEYVNGGELFMHLRNERKFNEEKARFYATEIVCALEVLHKNNIIYRDLKPENILIASDGHVKITDFGLSKEIKEESQKALTICGTPEYLAPEIFKGLGHDKAVDWWSLGIFLYEMIVGYPPYYGPNKAQILFSIANIPVEMKSYFSNDLSSLISSLLKINPKNRIGSGSEDALEIKKHPFFQEIDWEKVQKKEYPPPYIPNTSDKGDFKYAPKLYLDEDPSKQTPCNNSKNIEFQGFTYQKNSQKI